MNRIGRMLTRSAAPIRWGSWAAVLLGAFLILRSLPLERLAEPLHDFTEALQAEVDGLGAWGPLVFGLLHLAAMLVFLPGMVFALAAGTIFSYPLAVVVVSAAMTAASAVGFLVARYVARAPVTRFAQRYPVYGAVNRAIERGGWKILFMLRLSPAIPFNMQNYLYGLTGVGFGRYLSASWWAILPRAVLYTYVGHLTKAMINDRPERTIGEWVLLSVGLLATAGAMVYMTRQARLELERQDVADNGENRGTEPAARPGKQRTAAPVEGDEGQSEPAHWPWGVVINLSAAALVLSAGLWSLVHPEGVEQLIERMLRLQGRMNGP